MPGTYKQPLSKPPCNGWHCVVDGYDFKRSTREELIRAIDDYFERYNMDGDAAKLVEATFCKENPHQCQWGDS